MTQSSNRQEFIDWLDNTVFSAIPHNFEEFTHKQLVDHIYWALFRRMEERGLVPADTEQSCIPADLEKSFIHTNPDPITKPPIFRRE